MTAISHLGHDALHSGGGRRKGQFLASLPLSTILCVVILLFSGVTWLSFRSADKELRASVAQLTAQLTASLADVKKQLSDSNADELKARSSMQDTVSPMEAGSTPEGGPDAPRVPDLV